LVYHGEVQGGHCKATNVKVSTADPAWVYARIGIYNAAGQLASDSDLVVLNLTTHQVVGPTNVGFCRAGPDADRPIDGYAAVPAAVLAGLGLSPCAGSATTTGAARSLVAFAGTWGAHEMLLVITRTGAGHLTYADLTACPSCSPATAPAGTVDFMLASVTNGIATGRVTASSDAKNWAVGLPVQATLSAGSPGKLLNVKIGAKQLIAFCNGTSAGQCGA
jgi:hypothetical protein